MIRNCELFNIYKKLQYIKKLKLIQKFDKMLCAVKKICKKGSDLLFANSTGGIGFTSDVSIGVTIDKARIEYVKCYGYPENGCFDEILLNEIRKKLYK